MRKHHIWVGFALGLAALGCSPVPMRYSVKQEISEVRESGHSDDVYIPSPGDFCGFDGVVRNRYDPASLVRGISAEACAKEINEYIDGHSLSERTRSLATGDFPPLVSLWVRGLLPYQERVDALVKGEPEQEGHALPVLAQAVPVVPALQTLIPERYAPERKGSYDVDTKGHTQSVYRLGGPVRSDFIGGAVARDEQWNREWAKKRRVNLETNEEYSIFCAEQELLSRQSAEKRIYLHEVPFLVYEDSAVDLIAGVVRQAVRGPVSGLENLLGGLPKDLPVVFERDARRQMKPVTNRLMSRFFESLNGAEYFVDLARPDCGLGAQVAVQATRGGLVQEVELVVQHPGHIAGLRVVRSYDGESPWDRD